MRRDITVAIRWGLWSSLVPVSRSARGASAKRFARPGRGEQIQAAGCEAEPRTPVKKQAPKSVHSPSKSGKPGQPPNGRLEPGPQRESRINWWTLAGSRVCAVFRTTACADLFFHRRFDPPSSLEGRGAGGDGVYKRKPLAPVVCRFSRLPGKIPGGEWWTLAGSNR